MVDVFLILSLEDEKAESSAVKISVTPGSAPKARALLLLVF